MAVVRCPGQDMQYWKLEDIYEIVCPHCNSHEIEFFKDDHRRICKVCGRNVLNPRNDMSCAKWCKHAQECLESIGAAELATSDQEGPG